jgi:hypothetical protein
MLDSKTYIKVSVLNLVFLLIGMVLGGSIVIAMAYSQIVHAQDRPNAKLDPKPSPSDEGFEDVIPALGLGGPVATNTLIANRIACDNLQVGSYDVLKIENSLLQLLQKKGILTTAEAQIVVTQGRAERPIRIRPQAPPPPSNLLVAPH